MIYEGTNEIQAIDLLVRKVLPDGGAGMSALLIELRDELDASREIEADVQRRLAQLRYLGTTVAMAAQRRCRAALRGGRRLPARGDAHAAGLGLGAHRARRAGSEARWSTPAAAFRRWVLPEFDMRLGIVKRACEARHRSAGT